MLRQLTAIMFTDMVGYTALMQEDERQAKLNRDRHRVILERHIHAHDGRILQFYGDGTLSVFQSAIEAVECAIEIQHAFRDEEPPIAVRIGVHTGDVIHDAQGVFGDGVNVAARIQGLSVPGGVLISEKVYDEVKNQPSIHTRPLGSFDLKNVKRPMEVFAVTSGDLVVPSEDHLASSRTAQRRSVAVLPFVNMSPDPDNEYFADGITEEIINALTRVHGLRVVARTSSFAFKNHTRDIRSIADELGVTHVLEGSVRRSDGRVRVLAQLNSAKDGLHLFSEIYEGSLEDTFKVQDEIADAIVRELSAHLGAHRPLANRDEGSTATRHQFGDAEAYSHYLRGRFHWARRTPEDVRIAVSLYRKALELDAEASLARSALATAYVFLGSGGHMKAAEAFQEAETEAGRALELDPNAGESHLALAAVNLFYHWDWDGAYRCFQKALSLTPGSSEGHQLYGTYLQSTGEHDEAVDEARTAVGLDPLSLSANQGLAEALLTAGRIEEAEEQADLTLTMDVTYRPALETMGMIRMAQGRLDDAARLFEELPDVSGSREAGAALRGMVYARTGREDEAEAMIGLLEEASARRPDVSLAADFALVLAALGRDDEAIEALEEARDRRLGVMVFLAHGWLWRDSPLREDPRFQELLEEIGAPEGVTA